MAKRLDDGTDQNIAPRILPIVFEKPAKQSTPFKFKLNVKRKKYNEDELADELDEKAVEYYIHEYVESNSDLYFIKLVAGRLRKKYTDLIVIKRRTEEDDGVLEIDYRKTDDIQSCWADAMEEIKLMIDNSARYKNEYLNSTSIYRNVILQNETLLVVFSKYVSFLMANAFKWLVQKYNTQYELVDRQQSETDLVVSLMREFHRVTGDLRSDLYEAYF